MSTYNPEFHHRRSVRLPGYDYAKPGYYFVTICPNDIRCMLATIEGKRMVLTPIGDIARKYWLEIPRHYPNVKLDEFAVMPDHFTASSFYAIMMLVMDITTIISEFNVLRAFNREFMSIGTIERPYNERPDDRHRKQ